MTRDEFLRRHARRELSPAEKDTAIDLLELQRNALLMFTSCGWFFDDLAGLEGRQILEYAGRAIDLAQRIGGPTSNLEEPFLSSLAAARSNDPERGDGRQIYEDFVRPARAAGVSTPGDFGMFRGQ